MDGFEECFVGGIVPVLLVLQMTAAYVFKAQINATERKGEEKEFKGVKSVD